MKQEFAFVVDQAGWPAFLVDDSGMIRRTNPTAVALLGTVMDGQSALSATIWAPENSSTPEEFLRRLERSSVTRANLLFRIKGGETVAWDTLVCPYVHEGKRFRVFQLLAPAADDIPSGAGAVGSDTLPGRIPEFGAAQKQKLDCALQLSRTVALDFNNALTTILGHASLLLSRMEPGHAWRNSLMQIEKSAERAAEIAQDLADFSRQDKDARTQAPGNLNSTIRSAVDLFRGSGQSKIIWNLRLEKRLYTVTFDEAKMQQALLRLLENSVEAVGDQGRISVRSLNHSFDQPAESSNVRLAAGHYVCVEVTDNGAGIPAEVQPRVFEPFFTTKEDPKHRGLGLAWVYGIVTNHGGLVSISSQPGSGTTVRMFLPAQQKVVRDQGTRVEDLRGHETILFVDDEEMLLNLGQTVLTAFGYQVLAAGSGQEALELFQRDPAKIHLVITDLVMPGMSGRELVEQLRAMSPNVPILCTSGYLRQVSEGEERTYLRKPFTSQELLRRVRQTLKRL